MIKPAGNLLHAHHLQTATLKRMSFFWFPPFYKITELRSLAHGTDKFQRNAKKKTTVVLVVVGVIIRILWLRLAFLVEIVPGHVRFAPPENFSS